MPTYRSILKKTFVLTVHNKKLIFLGFFLALLGNGGEYDVFIRNAAIMRERSLALSDVQSFVSANAITERLFNAAKNLINFQSPFTNFLLILAFAGFIYLTITAQGALVASVYNAVKKNRTVQIKKAWFETRGKFFELLAANVIFKGGGFLIALLISAPVFMLVSSATSLSISNAALLVGATIFTPLAIIVSFLTKYTLIFIVAKNKPPLDAFYQSVKLFKTNWLITLENALLLFFLNFALGFVTWLLAIIISFPIVAALALTAYPFVYPSGHYVTIIAWASIALIPLVGGFLSVFQYASWTVLFTKLTAKRKLESKILRMAAWFAAGIKQNENNDFIYNTPLSKHSLT